MKITVQLIVLKHTDKPKLQTYQIKRPETVNNNTQIRRNARVFFKTELYK
jgi:hypothetical protein